MVGGGLLCLIIFFTEKVRSLMSESVENILPVLVGSFGLLISFIFNWICSALSAKESQPNKLDESLSRIRKMVLGASLIQTLAILVGFLALRRDPFWSRGNLIDTVTYLCILHCIFPHLQKFVNLGTLR